MLSHSELTGAEGYDGYCEVTHEVAKDQCRALKSIQQARVTLGPHLQKGFQCP